MRESVVGQWYKDGESSGTIGGGTILSDFKGSDGGRGGAMECLVCQDEDLKENPLVYREPVEFNEERGHMVMFVRPSDQLGSSVLD